MHMRCRLPSRLGKIPSSFGNGGNDVECDAILRGKKYVRKHAIANRRSVSFAQLLIPETCINNGGFAVSINHDVELLIPSAAMYAIDLLRIEFGANCL